MFEVKVTVELPGIPEALNNLARAITESGAAAVVKRNRDCAKPAAVSADAEKNVVPFPASAETPAPAAPASVGQPVPAPVAPPAVPTPVETPATVPTPAPASAGQTVKPVTMNDLSVAGAKLVELGKMDAVVNLLKNFGVAAITQLKEEQYVSFAASLRALGADI